MANTSVVYARIDTKLKDNAETILAQLGISPSSAIQMLYSQIVLRNGIPFAVHLPAKLHLSQPGNPILSMKLIPHWQRNSGYERTLSGNLFS